MATRLCDCATLAQHPLDHSIAGAWKRSSTPFYTRPVGCQLPPPRWTRSDPGWRRFVDPAGSDYSGLAVDADPTGSQGDWRMGASTRYRYGPRTLGERLDADSDGNTQPGGLWWAGTHRPGPLSR